MAVEVYSDSIAGFSPRISFSDDLNEAESIPVGSTFPPPCRLDSSLLDSSSGFEFAFHVSATSGRGGVITQETSTADELFADGMILPMDIIKKEIRTESPVSPDPAMDRKSLKELLSCRFEDRRPKSSIWKFRRSYSLNCCRGGGGGGNSASGVFGSVMELSRSSSVGAKRIQEDHKPTKGLIEALKSLLGRYSACESNQDESKQPAESRSSFKFFTRSTSLNCDNNGRRRTRALIGSLNFLSRSNSTGSTPNPAHLESKKRYQKLHCEKRSSSAVDAKSCVPQQCKKRQVVNKLYGANYKASTGVSPVLNLPSPCVSSVCLFRFGLFLCTGTSTGDRKRTK
ncbi:hypothetical protein Dimus_014685 [Dionaea muscipula]